MTEGERLLFEEVRMELDAARRALADVVERRRADEGASLALERLDPTYLLRLYATFEGLLRTRPQSASDKLDGLSNLVQQLAGEGRTLDPATDRELEWWKLFARDRNPLMHGHNSPRALSVNITIAKMQAFLSQHPV